MLQVVDEAGGRFDVALLEEPRDVVEGGLARRRAGGAG